MKLVQNMFILGGGESKNENTLSYFRKVILVQHQKCINVYSHTNRSKKT